MPNDSDAGLVRFLAEKVMRWKCDEMISGIRFIEIPGRAGRLYPDSFNPLESLADAFEVQSKVREDKQGAFIRSLWVLTSNAGTYEGFPYLDDAPPTSMMRMVSATARQRSTAIARAYGWEE